MSGPADLFNPDERDGAGWLSGVEGRVAVIEDATRSHRVQCVIPIIDEEAVYPIWARRMCYFVGPPGYGEFHPPAIGSEVVLFGRLGDTNNLFYAPLYNEDSPIPSDFQDPAVRGIRVDGDYVIISAGNLVLRGGKIIIEADASVIITGPAGIFQKSGSEGS